MAAGAARRPGGNRSPEHVPGGCGHRRQLPDRSCCGKGFRFHRMLAPGRAPLAGLIELVYRDKAAPQIALMPFGSSPKPVSIGSRHPRLVWSQLPASSKSNGAGAPLDRESQVRSGLVGGGSGSQRTRWWREMDSNPRSPSLDTHPLTALTPSPGNRRSTDQPRRSSAIICTNHHVSGAAEPQHWRHSRSS